MAAPARDPWSTLPRMEDLDRRLVRRGQQIFWEARKRQEAEQAHGHAADENEVRVVEREADDTAPL